MKTKTSRSQSSSTPARKVSTKLRRNDRQLNGLKRLMSLDTGKVVQFETAAEHGSLVYIAGSFNNWNPDTHPLTDEQECGVFRATLSLPAGAHEYKFLVDGIWRVDTACPNWAQNEHGTLNSVIQIGETNLAT